MKPNVDIMMQINLTVGHGPRLIEIEILAKRRIFLLTID